MKTKSLRSIEEKMEAADADPMRHRVLSSAKSFKTSWIELGQSLYTVWKEKLYRNWGYYSFDTYTSKEIGIKKQTALKLLRSYYFLEKEEPKYLAKDYSDSAEPSTVPSYESVNLLRLAKNKKEIDEEDYRSIKKNVLEKGKDPGVVKKDLVALMRQREELEPEEARQKKRTAQLKRFISLLKSLSKELASSKTIPAHIVKDVARLIHALEAEIS